MESRFLTKLIVEDDGGFPFILQQPFVYESELLGRAIIVPVGQPTDYASIPRLLQNIFSPVGKYDGPAVLHDYLYETNGVTRAQADGVLNEAMGVMGVGAVTRRLIYAGVRIGGWVPWRKYRAKPPQTAKV